MLTCGLLINQSQVLIPLMINRYFDMWATLFSTFFFFFLFCFSAPSTFPSEIFFHSGRVVVCRVGRTRTALISKCRRVRGEQLPYGRWHLCRRWTIQKDVKNMVLRVFLLGRLGESRSLGTNKLWYTVPSVQPNGAEAPGFWESLRVLISLNQTSLLSRRGQRDKSEREPWY